MIKPDVFSWRNIQVSNAFTVSQKMTNANNRYGLDTSSDTHMMKSSEWGIVAYLSQSKYGKYGNEDYTGTNKEVYQNDSRYYYTGRSIGFAPATLSYSENGSYTYSEKILGTGASTTGTIYGVYDMNGGSYENTMSTIQGTISQSGFSSLPNSKYYDRYPNTYWDPNEICDGICYGNALGETYIWYNDITSYGGSTRYPWALRGGDYTFASSSGLFFISGGFGAADDSDTFRIVLVP